MKKSLIPFILLLVLVGCSTGASSTNHDDKVQIYTSIYPIQYATERIAGDIATVDTIYPPGVDTHNYEPTSKEITYIAEADAFFYVGGNMESFASTIQTALTNQDLMFIELSDHNELFEHGDYKHDEDEDESHGHDHDPHIWLDPLKMIDIGEIIQTELSANYPEHATVFAKNFDIYKSDMETLDKAYKTGLSERDTDYFLVTHGAYEYWEESYGIKQIPIRGRSNSDEPSQKDLVEVAKLAVENNIKYVLFEQNNDDYVSTIILNYLDGEKLYLHNLEVLTAEDISKDEDYLSLMQQNLAVLIKATKIRGEKNE